MKEAASTAPNVSAGCAGKGRGGGIIADSRV